MLKIASVDLSRSNFSIARAPLFQLKSLSLCFILMLRGRVGCLRQHTLPLSIRINTGSLYRNVSILNYKRDKIMSARYTEAAV